MRVWLWVWGPQHHQQATCRWMFLKHKRFSCRWKWSFSETSSKAGDILKQRFLFSVNVFWKRLGVNLCVSCRVVFSVLWLDKDSVSRGCWSGYSGVSDLTTMMTSLKFWFHFALFLASWIRRFGATVHTEREREQTLDPTWENSLNSSGMLSSSSTSSSYTQMNLRMTHVNSHTPPWRFSIFFLVFNSTHSSWCYSWGVWRHGWWHHYAGVIMWCLHADWETSENTVCVDGNFVFLW